jgi:hypothetical protein
MVSQPFLTYPNAFFSCPAGEIVPVVGTPFDFTTPHIVAERIGP